MICEYLKDSQGCLNLEFKAQLSALHVISRTLAIQRERQQEALNQHFSYTNYFKEHLELNI